VYDLAAARALCPGLFFSRRGFVPDEDVAWKYLFTAGRADTETVGFLSSHI